MVFFKEKKANCISLQETHSVKEDVNFWKSQWGDSIFVSQGTSYSAGVMILFSKFSRKIINIYGHWLIVIAEINDVNLI